ncbi:thrombomodulin-like [Toxotes jaculatrix]|uniref:thrombomodulin-like n=1 Tax=Toxotes jaculatrix TaxID=941984 RepID=UPI001B3B0FAB|nr:thrombomodulin-like [Toxotes jaculatrix]
MIPTTRALLICVISLCGLQETVHSQRGHCDGDQCVALLQKVSDFPGARKHCEEMGGQLFVSGSEQEAKKLRSLLSGLSASAWLERHGTGRTETAAGLQKCPSISVSKEGNLAELWKPCRDKLDGIVCQYTFKETCSRLQASSGGAQVRYFTHMGFEVSDLEAFPQGTIAVTEKVDGKYPDSKHLCFEKIWLPAPWICEVFNGGCEHGCNSTCICPAGRTLHPNNITCTKDPCADCSHGCRQEGDSHVCTCFEGYRLAQDGVSCEDVNECVEQDVCTGEGEECFNTEKGYECRCKYDYVEDDGECISTEICQRCEHMLCDKVSGVYQCMCRPGFKVSSTDPTKCVQHCVERDCPARCITTEEGKEDCFCLVGYIKDVINGTTLCTDINECEDMQECDHKCENVFGSYRCLCDEGFKLHDGHTCKRIKEVEEEEEEDGSGSSPSYPTMATNYLDTVPSYVKTGSVLGITVFMLLCAGLLFFLFHNMAKRCGRFELSSIRHRNIDIFYLQQVTTDTYKRLSCDKQFKNDLPRP